MFKKFRHSRSGFTLVELLLAMTIISIMGAMTILVYFSVTENSRRLQMTREISETARQITERISAEVRENGIDLNAEFDSWNPTLWEQKFLDNYKADGSTILAIKKKQKFKPDGTPELDATGNPLFEDQNFFIYGKKEGWSLRPCDFDANTNPQVKCGLFFWKDNDAYNLVDSFRADESQKRVRITDLRFYISGGDNSANKVTLKMTLELAPGVGVPDSLIRSSKMEVQTTFSERPYKIQ